MRRTYLSMTWTPGVSVYDAKLLIHTVEALYELLRHQLGTPGQFDPLPDVRVFGAWAIPAAPEGAAYADVGWCVERSLDDAREAILTSRYLELIRLEPWQSTQPHFDLCLTDLPVHDDLGGLGVSRQPVLGYSRRGLVSLISTYPLNRLRDIVQRRQAIKHVFANFIGQLFDVPAYSRLQHVDEHAGASYCTRSCAMRYTATVDDAVLFGRQQEAAGQVYCPECRDNLLAQIVGFHYGLN